MKIELYNYEGDKLIVLKSNSDEYIDGETYNEIVTTDTNGQAELSMVLPTHITVDGEIEENHRWAYIVAEYKIKITEDGETPQWFKIKSANDVDENGELTSNIQCKSIAYDLNKKRTKLSPDITDTAENIIAYILDGTDWSVGTVDTFGGATNSLKSSTTSNALSMLNELIGLFDGYLEFNTDTKEVNFYDINNVEDTQIDFRPEKNLRSLNRQVTSDEIVTRLYAVGAEIETGTVGIQTVNPTAEEYIDNFQYYINNGMLNATKQAQITQYNSDITTVNGNLATAQSNINTTNGSISTTTIALNTKTYTRDAKLRRIDEIDTILVIETNATKISQLNSEKSTLQGEVSTLNGEISSLESALTTLESTLTAQEAIYDGYLADKDAIKDAFYSNLGEFIHEGLYSNANLVEPSSIYNEAVRVLEEQSIPKVYYSLTVADLSSLEGYEFEKIKLGALINITDPFLKINTKVRITKIIKNLEKPLETKIEVANYYSNLDEVLKDLAKNSEILKQQQNYWDRTVNTVEPDGSVAIEQLQKSFDDAIYQIKAGVNDSVIQDENGITFTDLGDSNNKVRINGDVIETSKDGGTTWIPAVSSNGANLQNVFGGVLDITEMYLKGDTYFFWNGDGFFAIDSVDSNKFIKFNKDGLFFTLDNEATYELSMTWSGLTIGAQDGAVKISSTDGIEVIDDSSQVRVKIGETSTNVYGMNLYYSDGSLAQETLSDGTVRSYDNDGNIIFDGAGLNSLQLAGFGIIEGFTISLQNVTYTSGAFSQYSASGSSTFSSLISHTIPLASTTGISVGDEVVFGSEVRLIEDMSFYVSTVTSVNPSSIVVDSFSLPPSNGAIISGDTFWIIDHTLTDAGCTADVVLSTGELTRPDGSYYSTSTTQTLTSVDFEVALSDVDGLQIKLFWLDSNGILKYGNVGTSGATYPIYSNIYNSNSADFLNPRTTSIGGNPIDENAIIIGAYLFGWGIGQQQPYRIIDKDYRDIRALGVRSSGTNYGQVKLAASNARNKVELGRGTLSANELIIKKHALGYGVNFAIASIQLESYGDDNHEYEPTSLTTGAVLFVPKRSAGYFGSFAIGTGDVSSLVTEFYDNSTRFGYIVSPNQLGVSNLYIERAWLEEDTDKEVYLNIAFRATGAINFDYRVSVVGF